MILLDTNIISEMMRKEPNLRVLQWLDSQDSDSVYISAITCAELRYGVGAMPAGKRKTSLEAVLKNILELFSDKVLSFDAACSANYAELAVRARIHGKGLPTPDGYIAAIAQCNGCSIATRDTRPFESVGLTVINPWNIPI